MCVYIYIYTHALAIHLSASMSVSLSLSICILCSLMFSCIPAEVSSSFSVPPDLVPGRNGGRVHAGLTASHLSHLRLVDFACYSGGPCGPEVFESLKGSIPFQSGAREATCRSILRPISLGRSTRYSTVLEVSTSELILFGCGGSEALPYVLALSRTISGRFRSFCIPCKRGKLCLLQLWLLCYEGQDALPVFASLL